MSEHCAVKAYRSHGGIMNISCVWKWYLQV